MARIILYPRVPDGKAISKVTVDGKEVKEFSRDTVILASPARNKKVLVSVDVEAW